MLEGDVFGKGTSFTRAVSDADSMRLWPLWSAFDRAKDFLRSLLSL